MVLRKQFMIYTKRKYKGNKLEKQYTFIFQGIVLIKNNWVKINHNLHDGWAKS